MHKGLSLATHRKGIAVRVLVYALSLVVASGGAYAQRDPRPKSATSPDVGPAPLQCTRNVCKIGIQERT